MLSRPPAAATTQAGDRRGPARHAARFSRQRSRCSPRTATGRRRCRQSPTRQAWRSRRSTRRSKNKPTILAEALDIAIAGDDEPIAIDDRDWMSEVWTSATGEERLLAYARAVAQIMTRASDMFMVVASAARRSPTRRSCSGDTASSPRRCDPHRRIGQESVTRFREPGVRPRGRHRLAPQQPGRSPTACSRRRLVDRVNTQTGSVAPWSESSSLRRVRTRHPPAEAWSGPICAANRVRSTPKRHDRGSRITTAVSVGRRAA